MIRIVTRADDAGCAKSANLAIKDSCTNGVARNISLMACGGEIEHAAAILQGLPNVSYGMHISLNCEWLTPSYYPVAPSELVKDILESDNSFTQSPRVLHERNVPVDQLMIEVKAQLDKLRSLGFKVTYMDEHMGVGWISNTFNDELCSFARKEGLIFQPDLNTLGNESKENNCLENFKYGLNNITDGDYLFLAHPVYPGTDFHDFALKGQESGEEELNRDIQRRCFMNKEVIDIFSHRNIQAIRYDELA